MKSVKRIIEETNPCREATEFILKAKTFKRAWETCERGDWMLWIAAMYKVDIEKLTKAKALCANTVRHLMRDERSANAIDVALRFAEGKATLSELNDAANAAKKAAKKAAANAAYAANAAAAYAAYAAAYAAYAAYDAAYAAYDAAYSANAAYNAAAANAKAAYAAAYVSAKTTNILETANICRKTLTDEMFLKLK